MKERKAGGVIIRSRGPTLPDAGAGATGSPDTVTVVRLMDYLYAGVIRGICHQEDLGAAKANVAAGLAMYDLRGAVPDLTVDDMRKIGKSGVRTAEALMSADVEAFDISADGAAGVLEWQQRARVEAVRAGGARFVELQDVGPAAAKALGRAGIGTWAALSEIITAQGPEWITAKDGLGLAPGRAAGALQRWAEQYPPGSEDLELWEMEHGE